jgi:hypothetical protein
VLEALQQASGTSIGVIAQRFDDLLGLSTARLGDRNQLSVSLFELVFSFLAFAPGLVLCSR